VLCTSARPLRKNDFLRSYTNNNNTSSVPKVLLNNNNNASFYDLNLITGVFADETHRRERSAFQWRQASGPRTGALVSGHEIAAARGQIQCRTSYPHAPLPPV